MTILKKETTIISLNRQNIVFYGKNTEVSVPLPEGILHNMELVQADAFYPFLQSVIKQQQVKSGKVLIILGEDVTFAQGIKNSPQQDETVAAYLDIVPFEEVLGKRFTINNNSTVLAASKKLCSAIIDGFQKEGFTITGLVPVAILYIVEPVLTKKFDAGIIRKHADIIAQFSLTSAQKK